MNEASVTQSIAPCAECGDGTLPDRFESWYRYCPFCGRQLRAATPMICACGDHINPAGDYAHVNCKYLCVICMSDNRPAKPATIPCRLWGAGESCALMPGRKTCQETRCMVVVCRGDNRYPGIR